MHSNGGKSTKKMCNGKKMAYLQTIFELATQKATQTVVTVKVLCFCKNTKYKTFAQSVKRSANEKRFSVHTLDMTHFHDKISASKNFVFAPRSKLHKTYK